MSRAPLTPRPGFRLLLLCPARGEGRRHGPSPTLVRMFQPLGRGRPARWLPAFTENGCLRVSSEMISRAKI